MLAMALLLHGGLLGGMGDTGHLAKSATPEVRPQIGDFHTNV